MRAMHRFNFKYLVILGGLLFVTAVAIDPLHHDIEIHDHHASAEVECQLCENEQLDTDQYNARNPQALFSKLLKIEINHKFISQILKSFHSRAPPIS